MELMKLWRQFLVRCLIFLALIFLVGIIPEVFFPQLHLNFTSKLVPFIIGIFVGEVVFFIINFGLRIISLTAEKVFKKGFGFEQIMFFPAMLIAISGFIFLAWGSFKIMESVQLLKGNWLFLIIGLILDLVLCILIVLKDRKKIE